MPKASAEADLLIFEYGGSGRSGKGTIVEHLSKTRQGVAKDETGLYYRKLTFDFLDTGRIDLGMTSAEIIKRLSVLPVEQFERMLKGREIWGEGDEKKKLYSDEVNRTVADIGQVSNARKAVKSGFAERIRSLVKAGEHQAVVIDGRNLSEVVKAIDGARLALRTFVDCAPYEAALRESSRNSAELTSPEGRQILKDIELRNAKDRTRQEDPLVVDDNAIDFWQDSDLDPLNRRLWQCDSAAGYLDFLQKHETKYPSDRIPTGVGRLAAKEERQIFFDTTLFRLFEDPVGGMLAAADKIFDEVWLANS